MIFAVRQPSRNTRGAATRSSQRYWAQYLKNPYY